MHPTLNIFLTSSCIFQELAGQAFVLSLFQINYSLTRLSGVWKQESSIEMLDSAYKMAFEKVVFIQFASIRSNLFSSLLFSNFYFNEGIFY